MENNAWNDTDDEENEEYEYNDVPPEGINDDFRQKLIDLKHKVYNNTVLSPEIGSEKVHNNGLLQEYLNNINHIYILSISAQNKNNIIDSDKLKDFPEEIQNNIKDVLEWIQDYFTKNSIPDTIPYTDYIRNTLKIYPFSQNNSFN
jgi:hypothetical protein